VIRAYSAAGVFGPGPLRYISTYAGRDLPRQAAAVLSAACSVLIGLARGVSLWSTSIAPRTAVWRKSVLCAMAYVFRVPMYHFHDGRPAGLYQRGCNALRQVRVRLVRAGPPAVCRAQPRWRDEVHKIEPAARHHHHRQPIPVPVSFAPLRRPARRVLFLAWLHKDKGVLDLLRRYRRSALCA